MKCDSLKASVLKQRQRPGARTGQFDGAARRNCGQNPAGAAAPSISRASSHQGFGAAAMLLRQMQIARNLQHHGNLVGKRAGTANIFLRNAGAVQPVEHGKHAQHSAVGPEQRHGQELVHMVLGDGRRDCAPAFWLASSVQKTSLARRARVAIPSGKTSSTRRGSPFSTP